MVSETLPISFSQTWKDTSLQTSSVNCGLDKALTTRSCSSGLFNKSNIRWVLSFKIVYNSKWVIFRSFPESINETVPLCVWVQVSAVLRTLFTWSIVSQ